MDKRTYSAPNTDYKYGFNGMERDDEVAGNGNSYTAEFWEYDGRIGRRFNMDRVVYPWASQYACFHNNPFLFSDPNGNEPSSPSESRKDPPTKNKIQKLWWNSRLSLKKAFTSTYGSIDNTSIIPWLVLLPPTSHNVCLCKNKQLENPLKSMYFCVNKMSSPYSYNPLKTNSSFGIVNICIEKLRYNLHNYTSNIFIFLHFQAFFDTFCGVK